MPHSAVALDLHRYNDISSRSLALVFSFVLPPVRLYLLCVDDTPCFLNRQNCYLIENVDANIFNVDCLFAKKALLFTQ